MVSQTRTVKKPTEAQILFQLATCMEEAIDLWLDQERRITVKEIRAWQLGIRTIADRLVEKGS